MLGWWGGDVMAFDVFAAESRLELAVRNLYFSWASRHTSHVTRHAPHVLNHATFLSETLQNPIPSSSIRGSHQVGANFLPSCDQNIHVAGPCSPICIRHFHHYRAQQISAMFATQCAFAECRVQHRAEQDRDSSRVSCAVFARAHSSPISSCMKRRTSHVTRHTSHVTRHTSHVTRHTSHVTRHTSHVTRHTSHVARLQIHAQL
jgi:hypothetical protein